MFRVSKFEAPTGGHVFRDKNLPAEEEEERERNDDDEIPRDVYEQLRVLDER